MTAAAAIDAARFRAVLGHFCTGVAVVTGHDGTAPVGFACQSFAALSLDPPLVLFCPSRNSGSWPVIERSGSFAVNVLSEEQQELSAVFGARGVDKFASVPWQPGPSGAPLLDGALTWLDCSVETVHPAGDHYVVIGRVRALGAEATDHGAPLLFYRGQYAATRARTELDTLYDWPRPDDWL
ncbi:3-hydroxy-9,10-secoandrosta-1,3,5(10)-triene-9,17-dione monooxygenase reductase subunit [Amycolatopsis magusensis]|uniref:3-hydroxy-9,10-secoandrosta-1,3,5(10)-triene-9, 17-dione monooxygenase reductase component n=1 Tax=Amycolatopsis magusensis TaxID=882444 RepID=A0ABS4Q2M1_9PSEU|nr:3-hydroxy-9,10-secoandrosta-1,3,5(10)-triene-9,17-dione monooxygenase reductase subunit [Amycolatopsis magusensis]MBP2185931.1 3-hydroxy-9,10-secoandrosta-1,3,5(10)-triene-9,17-dione monooxygenase reductase component [Amycolatopsis magusensis]